MVNLMYSIDENSQLAGINSLDVLLFSLGENSSGDSVLGLNVLRITETHMLILPVF